MAKTIGNVLKIVASKIEIGVSTAEAEPGTYTDLGLVGEETVKVKLDPIAEREAGGSEVQKGYDCSFETPVMEVLSGQTLETNFKNQFCWLKITPTGTVSVTNPVVRVKNFIANFLFDLDISAKGKSMVKINGKKYVTTASDFYTTTAVT